MRFTFACLLLLLGSSAPQAPSPATLELIETAPVETSLGDEALRSFVEVWRERIQAAEDHIELAHFYASDQDASRLTPVIGDLRAAGERGVAIRFLLDERFLETYPETAEQLAKIAKLELRRYDMRALTGGVMHAKYMLVDGEWVVFGSANFDWRSLEHIQELGVHARSATLCRAYEDVFEYDWHLAGGGGLQDLPAPRSVDVEWPLTLAFLGDPKAEVAVRPLFSPTGWLPDEASYDLPVLVKLIDGAERRVSVQVLTYRATERDGEYFAELENALRRAAARGVEVRLLVADWGKRRGTLEGLKSLQHLRGLEVRFVTIPPAAGGHIPFARVIHSKFLVIDAQRAWIGTSNWEAGYFHASRNVGLLLTGDALGRKLDERFEATWSSDYAYPVDPCQEYQSPRIGD